MIALFSLFITLYGQALHSSYNVYLTEGETYSLPMKELFKKYVQNFTIQDCPDNVQLYQTLNLLSAQNNNLTYISISSTPPHFLLITSENTLTTYRWNSTYINLINQVVLPEQTCFNTLQFQENFIFIDCYNLTNLNIYVQNGNSWTIVYSNQIQSIPQKTDLKSFTSNSINSILYAQYYDQYSILTEFQFDHTLLHNQSNWNTAFDNFIVSNKPQSQNTIYLWYQHLFYLLIVTPQGFNQTNSYYQDFQIMEVQIFYPQMMIYQCDSLLIIGIGEIFQYTVCNQQLTSNILSLNLIQCNLPCQVFLSNQFLILQFQERIEIYEIINFNYLFIGGLKLNSSFSQVSFDYDSNQLFIFSDTQILTYLITYPQLKFNSEQNQQNYQFSIIGHPYEINQPNFWDYLDFQVQLNVYVLNTDDNETYLIYDKPEKQHTYVFDNQGYEYLMPEFSGSLIRANFNVMNSSLGNFNDNTFKLIGSINQTFLNFQILNKDVAVGITNQTICLLNRCIKNNNYNCFLIDCIVPNNSLITIKNNQIQGYGFLFGVQINSQQLYLSQNGYQQFILNFQPFQQFYLVYQSIVLLLESNTIQICDLTGDCTNLTINNDSVINFFPVGIFLNQQSFSSILFINNNYSSVIIGQIIDQNSYIIKSIVNVESEFSDMKIVNNRMILSYSCQSSQLICFQVWNVQNLSNPFFEKHLNSINNSNNIQFFADNLFYYVQTNNYTYAYNPAMLEHSSQFYKFISNGSYFSSFSSEGVVSLISFNSEIYSLYPVLTYSYQSRIKNTITNQISFWSNIFNVSIQSQIVTQNQQIILLNDFSNIQLESKQFDVQNSHVILKSDNITSSGQIGWFGTNCETGFKITNIITETTMITFKCDQTTVSNQQILCLRVLTNYTLFSYYNISFQLYNISSAGKLINGSNKIISQSQCLDIIIQMNAFYIYFICYLPYLNSYQKQLFRITITNQSLSNLTYLTSFNINGEQIILQDDIIYIQNNYQIIIYQSNFNITQSIFTICQTRSIQQSVYEQQNESYYAIIYLCKDDANLYYLLGKSKFQEQITFIQPKKISLQDYFQFDAYILQILVLSQYFNQLKMMCFMNAFTIIIQLEYRINSNEFSLSTLKFQQLWKYSPSLFDLHQYNFIGATISCNLVIVGYLKHPYVPRYVIYNVSDFHLQEFTFEILLSSVSQFVNVIANFQQFQLPQIITFNSSYGFLLEDFQTYKISSFEIEIYLQSKKVECQLIAYNFINNKTAIYKFNYKPQTEFGFEYALLAFFIIVIIAAVILFWHRTKDQKEQFGLEEFEGLDVDTIS
ncbi:unnamed protein product (macronuclear) [Paramecium tetraurelia]|uniref:Transmembrane protein n=1 Tax=Paramecium tetraurelia TaxID=5888 RepID=A0BYS8_PARTE|nr:uncharacterized protein GSPATT00033548001 [Paramecium tetraurelia]CAK63695.1 unnamed protein product [Paramecium tetraurelia]|eukprot:XP_001431093.1 hypothetical protein (macronuclear) [Paramecium tetraurelia strain d4-2]